VKWEKYSYVTMKGKGNEIRKLQIVKCQTPPGQLFRHLMALMETFPAHQLRASWQNEAYKDICSNLPANHAVCVHDYSKNYRCSDKKEIQSSYFQRNEVSIHVSIIKRHRTAEDDTPENIITEQFFVISYDLKHDRHFTSFVQKCIASYLQSLNLDVKVMHEFCDGCSAQYKSRNCMGDVSCNSLGYDTLIRNYHETSHAKGPQDAAGGIIKRLADTAVLRGKTTIQNAEDFYNFANDSLEIPKSGIYHKRIFRYIKEIPRIEINDAEYKPVKENLKIHQIVSNTSRPSILLTRNISCYRCVQCVHGATDTCGIADEIGGPRLQTMLARNDCIVHENDVVAVYTADPTCEYYILKVTRSPTILETNKSDSWGNTFAKGTHACSRRVVLQQEQ